MHLTYSKEQKMLIESARTFFNKEWTYDLLREVVEQKGFSEKLWKKAAELGWAGMLIDESDQGVGGNFTDLCLILEEAGKALFISPLFVSSLESTSIITGYGGKEMKTGLLPLMAEGKKIVALAAVEKENGWSEHHINLTAEKKGGRYRLNGTKLFVPFADSSHHLICPAKEKESNKTSLFLIDSNADGVRSAPMKTFALEKLNKVSFDDVEVAEHDRIGAPGSGWEILKKQMPLSIVGRCMEMLGGIEKTLDMTVDHIKKRKQFGVPIGSFQALQHRCADMMIDLQASKYITCYAAWRINNRLSCRKEASAAKARTGEAYQRTTAQAHQLQGAMGFTDEYPLHFYFKHARYLQLTHGGGTYHRNIVFQESGYL